MFSALVLAALLLAPGAEPAADALPTGCGELDADTYSCFWTLDAKTEEIVLWDVPAFPRTLATITVTLTMSGDIGWTVALERSESGAGWYEISRDQHAASPTASARHYQESTHVFEGWSTWTHRLAFSPGTLVAPSGAIVAGPGPGHFEVSYLAERVPEGVVPIRPAATEDDPHLRDEPNEVAHPAWDIRAAWLDDARLEDGLFDVHLTIGDLGTLDESAYDVPSTGGATNALATQIGWKVAWTVEDDAYYVEWAIARGTDDFTCKLSTESIDQSDIEELRAHPMCTVDVPNSTFHAVIPEGSVGSPRPGALFEDIAARTRVYHGGATDVVDDANEPRYLFALGGPSVWVDLNPRLQTLIPKWYEDPLAAENLVDTVQIVGSLAALATFLVGLALVYRRRRQTSALLARVDAVEDEGLDSPQTLLKLGRLEQEFSQLFRKHRISDSQYQVLSQRIASVATRFALRRELGLDDGVPGEGAPLRKFSAKRN